MKQKLPVETPFDHVYVALAQLKRHFTAAGLGAPAVTLASYSDGARLCASLTDMGKRVHDDDNFVEDAPDRQVHIIGVKVSWPPANG